MSGQTHSLETESTTKALTGVRSPRRHRSFLHPRVKVRAASIKSCRSRKSVVSSSPQSESPSSRTSLPPKRTRILNKIGMAAVIGPVKSLSFKRLLNRVGGKHQVNQKAGSHGGDLDSVRGLLEGPTGNMAFYDIDVDMDSQPLSARSFGEEIMETDTEMMDIDSPATQFAAYREDSDPFATPQPSATMSVDNGSPSPLSAVTNRMFEVSQEAALRSRLKTLQMLGPEAGSVIAMKYRI